MQRTQHMLSAEDFADIPGTVLFDAQASRRGYWLNQFCMSLMKPDNRERFKADQRTYLDEWPMSEAQKQAVLDRDMNRCLALGGNIYFLVKIGATDGISVQTMVGRMTGMSEEAYRQMMLAGGRPIEGNRYQHEWDASGAPAVPPATPSMSALDSLQAEHRCRRLVADTLEATDAHDPDRLAASFTVDATLVRPGGAELVGRAAIRQAYAERDPERLTQHLLCNHRVDVDPGGSAAVSRCLIMLWSGRASDELSARGRPADAQQQTGEIVDRLVQTPEGWRIRRRDARFLFFR
jgi:protocatechuate 4,5-dioxygenase, alpha chain